MTVIDMVGDFFGRTDLHGSDKLRDLGDSLELVELGLELERELGVNLDRDRMFQIGTLGELTHLIEEAKQCK
jgi:acyl carrier protein